MRKLSKYISEALDDGNFIWKLDKWFSRDDASKSKFINALKTYKETSKIDLSDLDDVSNFVEFMQDTPNLSIKNSNLEYSMKKIFDLAIADKSDSNTYA